ncbi:MAG: DNA helicase RecQ [Salinivirgaceae bacterium]|nr:DNA helicase RecQ [Salinivirgaceae bacterium]
MELKDYLKQYFGFDTFKGNQEAIIKNILEGRDTFVLMPTGGGKSLCYQLPAMLQDGTAIVISPLIALMKNQVDAIRGFSEEEGVAHFLNSSLSKTEIQSVKEDVLAHKTKLLYVAPESLAKDENIQFLKQIKISFYAIDEAHCISEWGHDFRPEYRSIRSRVDEIGRAPIIALTATATPKVQSDIQKTLGMVNADVFKSSFNRPNLIYEVRPKRDVTREIIKYIKNNPGKSGIIYCLSRKKVEELAETLVVNGIKAAPYHAGLESSVRSANQDKFLMEEVDVIVATIAFGMGIDKPDVRFVIHHDMPKSLEGYYQETGRAGRDGGEGHCIAFYSYKDIQMLEKFMQGKPVAEQEIGRHLLLETVAYAESAVCRRRQLLHYFGEEYTEKNCGACDNCLHPRETFEGKDSIVKVLKTVIAVKEFFKPDLVASVLCGVADSTIKAYKYNEIPEFGSGKDHDDKYWQTIIRQAVVANLLGKNIENYGSLTVTEAGYEFIKNPHSFMIAKERDFEVADSEPSEGGGAMVAADDTLYSMLCDLRKDIAKKRGLPPYIIFQDPALQDMTIHYPMNLQELGNIPGVGQAKAMKFGQPFCELITKYVKENEIERPVDLVVKTMGNNSGMKLYIVQSIDRKLGLDVIADGKGLEMDELLTEMEKIVNSGTKLNIDYYIDENIDEDARDDIYEYFREAETDSLEEAIKELGEDDYTEEEIRLMRIKFICDEAF